MSAAFVFVCVCVGAGTYMFRYLPTRLRGGERFHAASGSVGRFVGAFLGAVGVAAVAALLAAALEPYVPGSGAGARLPETLAAGAGLLGTALAYRWRRDVAVATLVGALVFGVVWWLV